MGKRTGVFLKSFWQGCCLALLLSAELTVAAPKVDEARIRAIVAYKIMHFVVWPNKPSVLKLCTIGSTQLSTLLHEIASQDRKKVRITVNDYKLGVDLKNHCDALYIQNLNDNELKLVLKNVKEWPILTIGDSESFARTGGMIGLYTENDKVRFAVNINAVKDAGLLVKSQLLSLAKVIE